jgi:hypothetical protein
MFFIADPWRATNCSSLLVSQRLPKQLKFPLYARIPLESVFLISAGDRKLR